VIRELNAKKRPDSIDLGLGEPTLLPEMRYFEAALAWTREHGAKYTANAGDERLRERIADYYGYPAMRAASNVCITTGSQEAVYVAIKALLDPAHDELLIVEPAFPAYAKIARLEGIAARSVAMRADHDFAFDIGAIAGAVSARTRMIVLCSPCNPTGRVITADQARDLANALLARGGPPVYVLHDEIYRELTFVDDAGYLASHYPHAIVANSLSKSNALTGMRIGWLIASDELMPALVKTHAWVTSTANTFSQRLATEIFTTPGALQEHHAWYHRQRDGVIDALGAAGLTAAPCDGSFYAFVHVPGVDDSYRYAQRLIERENVVTIPGSIFGATAEGWLRLSWVAPLEAVRVGAERIASALNATLAKRVL